MSGSIGAEGAEQERRVAFERLVGEALDGIPAELRAQMSNVAVVVEDDPPPGEHLFGLFQGIPMTRRGSSYAGVLPDRITIYRHPIERYARGDPALLAEQVKRTVLHEIAHHFGISDQRLVDIDRY